MSGLVDAHAGERSATDAHEMVAGADAGPFRGASGDHVDHEQAVGGALEFHAEPDEVALDLGVEVVELAIGEEGRILVEPADRGRTHLHERDGRSNAEDRVGGAGDPGRHGFRILLGSDAASRDDPRHLLAVDACPLRRRLGGVGRHEGRFLEGDVNGPDPAVDEPGEVGGIDVMRADPREHLAVDTPRVSLGEASELVAECRLGVPPGDIAVEFGEVVLVAERRGERALAGGGLADAHDVRPAALVHECGGAGREILGGNGGCDRQIGRLGGDRCPGGLLGGGRPRSDAPRDQRRRDQPASADEPTGTARRQGTGDWHDGIRSHLPRMVAAAGGRSVDRSRLWITKGRWAKKWDARNPTIEA